MRDVVRVVKHRPLSQKSFTFAQRVLDRPVHAEAEFSFPTPDIKSLTVALDTIKNRKHEDRSMRNGEADLDSSPYKSLPRQDAHRPDHTHDKECLYPRLLQI